MPPQDAVRTLAGLAGMTRESMVFTFAPRTPLLAAMHAVGRWFPRGDRAPAIEPVAAAALDRMLATEAGLSTWKMGRVERISSGFYTSQAFELVRL
jgi:Magnesium-protoporphyrin IX methyltransferase C-terminus.